MIGAGAEVDDSPLEAVHVGPLDSTCTILLLCAIFDTRAGQWVIAGAPLPAAAGGGTTVSILAQTSSPLLKRLCVLISIARSRGTPLVSSSSCSLSWEPGREVRFFLFFESAPTVGPGRFVVEEEAAAVSLRLAWAAEPLLYWHPHY